MRRHKVPAAAAFLRPRNGCWGAESDRRGSIISTIEYLSAVENGPRLLCASQCAASQPRGTVRVLAASSTSSNRLRRRLGERIDKAASLGVCR